MPGKRKCLPTLPHPIFLSIRLYGRYYQIVARSMGYRWKILHRAIIHRLVLSSPHFFSIYGWPDPDQELEGSSLWTHAWDIMFRFDVHHIDHKTKHNCPSNLLLLDRPIHNALAIEHRRKNQKRNYSGRWLAKNV